MNLWQIVDENRNIVIAEGLGYNDAVIELNALRRANPDDKYSIEIWMPRRRNREGN